MAHTCHRCEKEPKVLLRVTGIKDHAVQRKPLRLVHLPRASIGDEQGWLAWRAMREKCGVPKVR